MFGKPVRSRKMKTSLVQPRSRFFKKPLFEVLEERNLMASRIWDGGGVTGNFSEAANWDGDVALAANDTLIFQDSGALSKNGVNDYSDGMQFDSIIITGSGFNLSSQFTNTIQLFGGLTANNTAGSNTVGLNLTLLNAESIYSSNAGTTLNLTGTINTANLLGTTGIFGTSALTFDGAGDTVVTGTGTITGNGSILKMGSGTLNFETANTYTGITDVRQGVILVEHNLGLGSFTDGQTTVTAGGALHLANNVTIAESLTLSESGTGFGDVLDSTTIGSLRSVGGANAVTGNIEMASNVAIGVNAGSTLNLSGIIGQPISGVTGRVLTKFGAGTMQFSGTQSNTFTGALNVVQGTVELNKRTNAADATTGIRAFGGALTIGDNFGADDSAVVKLLADNQIPLLDLYGTQMMTTTVRADGLLDLNGRSNTLGLLTLVTGTSYSADVKISSDAGGVGVDGLLTLGGDLTIATFAGSSAATPAVTIKGGTLDLGTLQSQTGITGSLVGRTFNIGDTTIANTAADLIVSSTVSGGAGIGLYKAGAGTLRLTGNNTYAGGTYGTATNGIVEIGSNTALGTGLISFASNTEWVAFGGARTLINDISWDGNFVALGTNALNFSGNVTLTASRAAFIMEATQTTTFSGVISESVYGSAGLTKSGRGTLRLTNANTYSGVTTVSTQGGSLILSGNGSILNSSSISVASNATLQLDNTGTNLSNRINDNAGITLNGGRLLLAGASGAATSETTGTLTVGASQASTIETSTAGGGSVHLVINQIVRSDLASSINFVGTGADLTVGGANRITIAYPTIAPNTTTPFALINGILPFATVTGSTGLDFATYDAVAEGVDIFALPAGEYVTDINQATATSNVKLSGANVLNSSLTVNSLLMTAGATLTGSGVALTIDSGALAFSGSGSASISVDALNLSPTAAVITTGAGMTATVNSILMGAATLLSKTGYGTLVLTGDNTFAGAVNINEGVVEIQHSRALGSTAAGTTVREGAALYLRETTFGAVQVGVEAITVGGVGFTPNATDNYSVANGSIRSIAGASNSIAGAIAMNGTNAYFVDLANGFPLLFGATNVFTVDAGKLTLTGSVSQAAQTDLVKRGAGVLELGGSTSNATITGATRVFEGTLLLNKTAGQVAVAGAVTVGLDLTAYADNSAQVVYGNDWQLNTTANTLTVYSTGKVDLAGHKDAVGNIILSIGSAKAGDIDIGAGGQLSVASTTTASIQVLTNGAGNSTGATILNGTLNWKIPEGQTAAASRQITVNDGVTGDDLEISSVISDGNQIATSAIFKDGFGTLVLSGSSTNTFAGTLQVREGELALAKTGGALALSGSLTIGNSDPASGYAKSDIVTWRGNEQLSDWGILVTVNNTGLMNVAGFTETIGQADVQTALTLNSGTVTLGSGSLSINGDITVTGSSGAAQYTPRTASVISGGSLVINGLRNLTITDDASLAYELIITSNISGAGGINKITSNGGVFLSGTNTFAGNFILTAGLVGLGSNAALGNGTFYWNTGTVVQSEGGARSIGNLTFASGTVYAVSMGASTAATTTLVGGGGNKVTFTGSANMVAATTFFVQNAGTLEFAGGLGESYGSQALTKSGFGQLVISAAATYSGITTINATANAWNGGSIILRDNGSILNSSSINIGLNGELEINNAGTANLTNRINDTNVVTLSGGRLTFVGALGAASTETIGAITLGAATTATQFASTIQSMTYGQAGSSAFLTAASIAQSTGATSTVYFVARGIDFGAASNNRLIFTALPTRVGAGGNEIIAFAVLVNANGSIDFANQTAVSTSVVAGTSTTVSALGGLDGIGVAGLNIKVTGNQSLTIAKSFNAILLAGAGLTISGTQAFTLTGGAIYSQGTGNTISTGVILGGNTYVYAQTDYNSTTDDLTISGSITESGARALTTYGQGSLVLSGSANAYSGATNILQGTTSARSSSAFGTTAGGVTVQGYGTLELANANVGAETLTVLGGAAVGFAANVAVRSRAGTNNTWGGNVVLTGTGGIVVDADSSAVGSLNIGSNTAATSVISGAGAVNKLGTGALSYFGVTANTYTGATNIYEGKLSLTKTGVNALVASVNVGDYIGTTADILEILANEQIIDNTTPTVTVNSTGRFNLVGSASETLIGPTASGAIVMNVGGTSAAQVNIGTGTLTLGNASGSGHLTMGSVTSGGMATTGATISGGTLFLQSNNHTFAVTDSASISDLTITSKITGVGVNEAQSVTIPITVDTYTLAFNGETTTALSRTVSTAADIQTALEALSSIGAGNVTVTGSVAGPFTVTFINALGNQDVPTLVATTVTGSGTVAIANTVNGGLITKTGTGRLVLDPTNNDSDFTGGFSIVNGSGGEVLVSKSTAFGNSGNVVTLAVNSGTASNNFVQPTLILSGGVSIANTLRINTLVPTTNVFPGTGVSFTGALRGTNGTNTWAGNISLFSSGTTASIISFGVDSGSTLVLGGTIGQINSTQAFTLTKVLPGTLQFAGSTSNNFTGGITLNEGKIQLNKTGGAQVMSNIGTLTIGNDAGGGDADEVEWLQSDQLGTEVLVTVTTSGLLDLNGMNETLDRTTGGNTLNMTVGPKVSGHITTGAGTLTLGSSMTANTPIGVHAYDGSGARIEGNLNLGGATRTFTVGDNASNQNELIIDALISNGQLNKANAGTLVLNNASNSMSGVVLAAGTLDVGNDTALGVGTITAQGGGLRARGATRTLVNSIVIAGTFDIRGDQNLVLNGTVTQTASATVNILLNNSAQVTFGNTITLGSSSAQTLTINEGIFNHTTTINTAIGDGGSVSLGANLTKSGLGTLVLGGTNTYNGITTVSAGVLRIASAGALGNSFNEVNRISMGNSLGTFTLTFGGQTTAQLSGAASAADIQSALEGLATIGAGNVSVTQSGSFYFVTYIGALGGTDVTALTSTSFGGNVVNNILQTTQGGGRTSVSNLAALEIFGGLTVNESLFITGQGFTSAGLGALRSTAGTNTWAGDVNVSGGGAFSAIGVDSGSTLTVTGSIHETPATVAGLTKLGGGTLELSGTQGNFYRGVTLVSAGTLLLNKTGGLATGFGTVIVGDNAGGDNADVVQYGASGVGPQIGLNASVIVNSSGLFNTANQSASINNVTVVDGRTISGDVQTGSGTLTLDTTNSEIQTIALSGTGLGGSFTVSFPGGTASATITVGDSAASVQAALNAAGVLPAGVTVSVSGSTSATGGSYTVTFGGALAQTNVPQFNLNETGLTGTNPKLSVFTQANGVGNEVQTVTMALNSAAQFSAGTFAFNNFGTNGAAFTSGALSYNASIATVQTALDGMFGAGNTLVFGGSSALGGVYYIAFKSSLGTANLTQFTVAASGLTGGTATAGTFADGIGNESQTYTLTGGAMSGTYTIAAGGITSAALAVNASAAAVQTELNNIFGAGNTTVVGAITAAGGSFSIIYNNGLANANLSIVTVTNPTSGTASTATVGDGIGNETQTITITGTTVAGTFTATVNGETTAAIAVNATAATVQAALEALTSVGTGNVQVIGLPGANGGTYTVVFKGALAKTNILPITVNSSVTSTATSTPNVVVATVINGQSDSRIVQTTYGSTTTTSPAATISGNLAIGGNNVNSFTVLTSDSLAPGAGDDLIISATISGAGNLTKGPDQANEVQLITMTLTSGTFTLAFGGATTAAIAFNANAQAVQAALENLATIGAGNVYVTGGNGSYTVMFQNVLGSTNQPLLTSATGGVTVFGLLDGRAVSSAANGVLALTAAETYAGATSIVGGTLSLRGAAGAIGSTSIFVGQGATLLLDNSAAGNNNRLSNSAVIGLGGGTFSYVGENNAASTETIGAIVLGDGYNSTIRSTTTGTGTAQLSVGSLVRTFNGTVNFVAVNDDLGSADNKIVFGAFTGATSGASGVGVDSVLPYAVLTQTASTEFVHHDAVNGIVSGTFVTDITTAAATDNVKVSSTPAAIGTKAINALMISGGSTVSGTGGTTLTLTSGQIISTGGTNSITNPTVAFGAAQPIVTVASASTLTIGGASSVITGTGAMRKEGAGTLNLAGNNTGFSGTITVNAGTLGVQNVGALGTTGAGAGTFVNSGAAIVVSTATGTSIGNEALTLSGTGIGGTGALRLSTAGTVTWGSGFTPFTLSASSSTAVAIGVASGGTLILGGTLAGPVGLTKVGTGTLELFGTSNANIFAGLTTVNEGTLRLNKTSNSVNAIGTGGLVIGDFGGTTDAVVYASTAGNDQIATGSAITVNNRATLDLANRSDTLGAITMTGGTISTGTGTWTMGGNVTYNSGGAATISGNLALGATARTFTINNGASVGDLTITSTITGSGAISKQGAGELILTGNNAGYSGTTTVGAGVIGIGSNSAIGTGTLNVASGGIVWATGGNRTLSNALAVTGTAVLGGRRDFGGTNSLTFTSTVTMGASTTFQVDDSLTNVQFDGVVSGNTFSLAKSGFGTLILAGNNTYTGATTVSAGILSVRNSNALGAGSGVNVTVALNAALQIEEGIAGPVQVANKNLVLGFNNAVGATGYLNTYTGAVVNVAGNDNRWTGQIFLQNNSTATTGGAPVFIGSTAGRLSLIGSIGAIDSAGSPLNGSGYVSAGVTKIGAGEIRYAGIDANTYAGATTVLNGTLILDKSPGAVAVRGTLVVGDGLGTTDKVQVAAAEMIADASTLTVNKSATFETLVSMAGTTSSESQQILIQSSSGTFTISYDDGSGPVTSGPIAFDANAATVQAAIESLNATFVGNVSVAANNTKALNGGTGPNSLYAVTFYGLSTDLNLLTVDGSALAANATAAVTLLANGGSASTTTVNGAITLGAGDSGGANVIIAAGTNFAIGANVTVNVFVGSTGNAGTEGVTISGSGNLALNGSARTFAVNDGRTDIELSVTSAIVDGTSSGAFSKSGLGRMLISGNNTFSGNEVQSVTVSSLVTNFTLTFGGQTTAALLPTATASEVQTALNALTSIGGAGANVLVTGNAGGPYTVTFQGTLGGTDVAQMTGSAGVLLATTATGGVTLAQGALRLASNNALGGSAQGTVTQTAGSALELTNNITISNRNISANGTGIVNDPGVTLTAGTLNGTGGIRNILGNNTWNGTTLTLGGTVGIGVDAGTLTLNIATSGAQQLTKVGVGTLELGGTTANAHSLATNVNQGILRLNKTGGVVAIAGTSLIVGDNVGSLGDDRVVLVGDNQIAVGNTATVNSTGLLDINGRTQQITALSLNAGVATSAQTTLNGGTLTLSSGVLVTGLSSAATATTISGAGSLNLATAVKTFTVNDTAAAIDLNVSAVISGTAAGAALQKQGLGLLRLSGANTYQGTTTVSTGTLSVSGGSAILDTAAVNIAARATFELVTNNETIGNLTGAAGSFITLNANTLTFGDGTATTFSGVASGTGGLTKQGSAIFTMNGANTYTGTTTINAGTMRLGGGAAIVDTGAVVIARINTAILDLNNTTETIGSLADGAGVTGGLVTMGTGALTVGDATPTTIFSGVISGTGATGLIKQGTGVLALAGVNTYSGTTTINAGTLRYMTGGSTATASTVTVANSGTLAGKGTVNGSVVMQAGGTIRAGDDGTGTTGTLTVRNVTFVAGSTLFVRINDGLSDYDVLAATVAGTNLGNATLSGSLGYTPGGTDNYNIISSAAGAVTGTFLGGSPLSIGLYSFVVNYDLTASHFVNLTRVGAGNIATWTGSGGDDLWSTAANWLANYVPADNDTVVFDTNSIARLTTNNNDLTRTFQLIYFDQTGVTIAGNAVTLNKGGGGITNNSGTNIVSMNLTIGTAAQTFTVTAGDLTIAGTVTASSSADINLTGGVGAVGAFTNNISNGAGSTNVAVAGSAAWTLSGTNTFNGNVTVGGASTLIVNNGNAITDTATVTMSSTAAFQLLASETIAALTGVSTNTVSLGANTLTTGNATNTAFAGVISGVGGSLTKQGTGTFTMNGANTYTGTTTISDGTMVLGGGAAIANASAVVLANLATAKLDLNNTSETIGSLAGGGGAGGNVVMGSGSLTLGGDNSTTSYSGVISGTGGITKTGSGVFTLGGTNTYTGTTAISAGTLSVSGGTAVVDSGAVTVAATATFDVAASEIIGSLTGFAGSFMSLGANTLTTGGNSTSTAFAGNVSGATGSITKQGSGTFTLLGTNTYGGTTTVSAGTLVAQGGAAIDNLGAVSVAASATFSLTNDETVGSLTGAVGSFVTLNAHTLSTGGAGTDNAFSGMISGTGGITKLGSGTFTMNGANSYTGTTTISAGAMVLGGGSAIADASAVVLSNTAGAVLDLNNANETIASLSGGGGAGGNVELGNATLTVGNSANTTYAGAINGAGGNVTKVGTGTLTLSGGNAYTGTLTVNAGTVLLSGSVAAASSLVVNNGSTFDLGSNHATVTLAGLTLSSGFITGTGTSEISSAANFDVQSGTISLILTGAGGLTKSTDGSGSGGIVILSGANTYNGITNINAGTLRVTGSIGAGSTVNVNASATLAGTGSILGSVNVVSGGSVRAGDVGTAATGTLTVNNIVFAAGSTLFIRINGATAGTYDVLALTGTADLGGSTLTVTLGYTPTNGTSYTLIDNTTVTAVTGQFSTGSTYTIGARVFSLNYDFGATHDVVMTFIATVATWNGNAANGLWNTAGNWVNNYIPQAGDRVVFDVTAGANLTSTNDIIGLVLDLMTFGASGFILGGNSITFSSAGGGITNTSGTNQVNMNLALSTNAQTFTVTAGSLTVGGTVNAGTTLNLAGAAAGSITGAISGAGDISESGSATWALSGNNSTHSGGITIDGTSVLQVNGGNAIGNTSLVTLATTGSLQLLANETIGRLAGLAGTVALSSFTLTVGDNNANTTFAGAISGVGGSITKQGTNSLILSGTNTYTGTTTVTAGTLSIAGGTLAATSLLSVTGGAFDLGNNHASQTVASVSLTGGGSITGTGTSTLVSTAAWDVQNGSISAIMDGAAGLNKTTNNTVTLSGANIYTGTSTISAGTLTLSGSLATTSALAVTGGAFDLGNNHASQTVASVSLTAGGSITGTGTSTLVSTAAWDVQNGTISAIMGGAAGLNKTTSGTVTLSGANIYTGTSTISAGTLTISGGAAIADAGAVTVNGGVLDVAGNETIGSLSGTGGSVTLGSNTLTTGGNGGTTSYAGAISGTGGLTKEGAGVFTLSGTNAYTGVTTINAGILRLAGGTAIADASAVVLANVAGATLDLNGVSETIGSLAGGGGTGGNVTLGAGTLTVGSNNTSTAFAGAINGTGGLTKTGSGTLTLSGGNGFTGTTLISAGSITLGASNVLAGSVQVNGGALNIGGNSDTVAGVSLLSGSITGSTGTLTSLSDYDVQSGSVTARLGGTVGLNKTGTGTVTLAGNNTYTGNTVIAAGKLVINGMQPSSDVTLNGGILGGAGEIGDLVANGGSVEPGNSPGLLTVNGNFTLGTATTYLVEVNGPGAAGVDWDQLAVTGAIDISGSTLAINLGYGAALGSTYTIIRNDGVGPIIGEFINSVPGWAINYAAGDGNDVALTFLGFPAPPPPAVPEIPLQIVYPGQNPTAGENANSSNDLDRTGSSSNTAGGGLNGLPPFGTEEEDVFSDSPNSLFLGQGLFSMSGPQDFREQDAENQRYWTDNGNSLFNVLFREVEGVILTLSNGPADDFTKALGQVREPVARMIAEGISVGASSADIASLILEKFPELDRRRVENLIEEAKARHLSQRVADITVNGILNKMSMTRIVKQVMKEFPRLDRIKVQNLVENAIKLFQQKSKEQPKPVNAPGAPQNRQPATIQAGSQEPVGSGAN